MKNNLKITTQTGCNVDGSGLVCKIIFEDSVLDYKNIQTVKGMLFFTWRLRKAKKRLLSHYETVLNFNKIKYCSVNPNDTEKLIYGEEEY